MAGPVLGQVPSSCLLAACQRRGQQRRVVPVRAGGDDAQRDAVPVAGDRALQPPLRRSTGDGPARSPPHGALVMHPSTAISPSSRPMIWS